MSPPADQAKPGTESVTRPDAETEPTMRRRVGEFLAKYGGVTITAGRLAFDVLTGRWPD